MIVCAGSGGVGKTTVSAALGVRAAQLGRRVLVLTVDPAKRLATALGLDLSSVDEHAVPLQAVPGSMSAAVIDSKHVFDEFIRQHANQAEIVNRIMKNRLYHQLSTTLSGSQEFTALERLLQALESERYDLVVLDTPPTKHAIDFLSAPERISALFQDNITRWFASPAEKSPGFWTSFISRGTRMALKSLEVLTGGAFIEELLDFFAAVRSIQRVLRDRTEASYRLLTSEKTGFVLITSFDAAKLEEAKYLQRELRTRGYGLRAVVINRAFPNELSDEVGPQVASGDPEVYGKVLNFYKQFKDYYSYRYNLYEGFSRGLSDQVAVLRLPEYQRDIHGLEDLEDLAHKLGGAGQAADRT